MTKDATWKTRDPGAEAAEDMRKRLRRTIQELDEGRTDEVRRLLREEAWLRDIDPAGVPDEVIRETREILREAREALTSEANGGGARDAVQRALVMW